MYIIYRPKNFTKLQKIIDFLDCFLPQSFFDKKPPVCFSFQKNNIIFEAGNNKQKSFRETAWVMKNLLFLSITQCTGCCKNHYRYKYVGRAACCVSNDSCYRTAPCRISGNISFAGSVSSFQGRLSYL
jgi:hypothetical protein